ncbi:MAG: thiolase domain-containing protein [Deltaproteobacteria bacterium]|jgi:acetyl-CoA C-acetyltransferase|nr:thiolase domain-containing protein [Deltaproteobacteria bacterium]
MAELCGVVGIGQTKQDAKRIDVSVAGLVREAAVRALDDAGCTWKDIDAVVIGKAPDMFEGLMMPELFLADALGAVGKPILRVHTAGSVGGSTALVAASLIQAGVHQRVLTVAYEKHSEGDVMWTLTIARPFSVAVVAGAGGYFAPLIRAYIRRSGAPEDTGIRVALKDRKNALKNPYTHIQIPDIDFEKIASSPMLWDPIRYLETCPTSDGACAMVLASEEAAKKSPTPPAWIHASEMRSEPTMFSGRDQVNPQAGRDCAASLYKKAGITNPRKELDVAEIYVPFSWFEPMWMENLGFAEEGSGWKMTYEGATAFDGDMPINCSGGVLSSNPIGASGMLRYAESAMQVRGQAGEHQVDGVRRALGHAYGGGSQYFAMWIVGNEKP